MKRMLIAAICLIGLQVQAQVSLPKNDEGEVVYSEVVKTPELMSDVLMQNATAWMKANFKAEKNRRTGLDNITDTQILKSESYSGGVTFDIKIQVRDERYKIIFSEFRHKDYDGKRCSGGRLGRDEPLCTRGTMSAKNWDKIKMDTDNQIKDMILNLKQAMVKVKKEVDEDDW